MFTFHAFQRFLVRKVLDLQAGQSSPRLRSIYGLDWIDNAKTTWVAFQMDSKKTSCPKDLACHFHHQSVSPTWVRAWISPSSTPLKIGFHFWPKIRKLLNLIFALGYSETDFPAESPHVSSSKPVCCRQHRSIWSFRQGLLLNTKSSNRGQHV